MASWPEAYEKLHLQVGYMAAPTGNANAQTTLADGEPSIHDQKEGVPSTLARYGCAGLVRRVGQDRRTFKAINPAEKVGWTVQRPDFVRKPLFPVGVPVISMTWSLRAETRQVTVK
jgi:hypothetical protein